MTYKFLAAAFLAAIFIGCADQIEVPDDPGAGKAGSIVYTQIDASNSNNPTAIRIIDSEGTLIRDLGPGLLGGTSKGKIVYASYSVNQPSYLSDIWVANADGSGPKLAASIFKPGQRIYGPTTMSPDGKLVAFATKDSISQTVTERVLHVVNADGTGYRQISNKLAYESMFALSPDGRKVAYFSSPVGSNWTDPAELVIANTDGTGSLTIATGLTTLVDFGSTIEWSPDGSKLAFGVEGATHFRINVINADGSGRVEIGTGLLPTWSPDGMKIAWCGVDKENASNSDIIMTADMGITTTTLTSTNESETHPQFSPDGKSLLCTIWMGDPMESLGKLEVIDLASKAATVKAEPCYIGFWVK